MSLAIPSKHAAQHSTRKGPYASDVALTLLLAALTILLGFEAGGYFADTTGWVAAGLALALGVSTLARGKSFGGVPRGLLLSAGALCLLAVWTLASAIWSGAPARALFEFDRVLLYLLVLLLFATARAPDWTLRRLPSAFVLGALVLCVSGVIVRTVPGSWPFGLPPVSPRMDYPLSYENALGLLATLGLVLSLHVASWRREHAVVRVAAAVGLPVFAAALILTFSRGALLAAGIGVALYVLLGFSRGLITAIVAAGAPVFIAVQAAYDADLPTGELPRSSAALAQGQDLAVLLGLTAGGAGALLAVLLPLERRFLRARLPSAPRSPIVLLMAALVVVAIAVGALAVGGTDVPNDVRAPVAPGAPAEPGAADREPRARDRLATLDVRGQSRPKYWRVSLDAFTENPVHGTGAGTWSHLWARSRPITEDVTEGHSLYLETLAELGVVGGLLLLVSLGSMLAPFVARLGRRSRPLGAAVLAAGIAWLVHAGLDWDWEMPAVSLWLFAVAGCALAASPRRVEARWLGAWPARAIVAAGCALVALTPAAVALSQARLDKAVSAFAEGDCGETERWTRKASSVLDARPEPFALQAYCAARRGDHERSLGEIQSAIERDPDSWQLAYSLAIVRGAAGLDPRPAARAALRLNPLEELTQEAVEAFSTDSRAAWRRRARAAPVPVLFDER